MMALKSVTRLWILSIFLFLLGTAALPAQTQTPDVSQYLHTSWTAQDGFFKGGIQSIAQTSDGYLWVSSTTGLLRFDGVRFVEWRPPSSDSLPGRPLERLLGSRDGSLWIGGTGLAELKANGDFRRYHQLDGTWIFALIEDRDGAIWAGGGGQPQSPKLCRFYHGESECFPANGFIGPTVQALYEDAKGQLWMGNRTGIWRLRPGPAREIAPYSDMIHAFAEDAKGTLIISGGGQVNMITAEGTVKPYPTQLDDAYAFLKDREGDLWVGTDGEGIVHVHEERTDRFTVADGLSFNYVYALIQDREGNVWAATGNGLHKFTKAAITTITFKQGQVNSVLIDRKGASWVGTIGGLQKFANGRLKKADVKLPDN